MNDRTKMWSQEIYFSPEFLKAINIPVLLVVGDRDPVVLKQAVEMYRLIQGGQFCVLPDTSHAVFSKQPALISEMAIHFFSSKVHGRP